MLGDRVYFMQQLTGSMRHEPNTCEVKIKRNIQDFSNQKEDGKSESKIKNPKLKPKSEVNKNCNQQYMSPLEKDSAW